MYSSGNPASSQQLTTLPFPLQMLEKERWSAAARATVARPAAQVQDPSNPPAAYITQLLLISESVGEVSAVFQRFGNHMNQISLAAAFVKLNKLAIGGGGRDLAAAQALLRQLVPHLDRCAPLLDAGQIASVVRSARGLGVELPAALRSALANRLCSNGGGALLEAAAPQHLTALASCYPHLLSADDGEGWKLLDQTVAQRVGELDPIGLALVASAFSRRGKESGGVFAALCAAASARVQDFDPGATAGFLSAAATSGHPPAAALLLAFEEALAPKLWQFSPKDLSNLLSAFAKLKFGPPAFMHEAGKVVALKIESYSARDLAMVLAAYAALRQPHQLLVEAASKATVGFRQPPPPRDLSSILSAVARLGHADGALFNKFAGSIAADIASYGPRELSKVVTAYGLVGSVPKELFAAVSKAVAQLAPNCGPKDLVAMATALAGVQPVDKDGMAALSARYKAIKEQLSLNQQRKLADAFGKA